MGETWNSRTTEIFSDQYGNHFQWTHIHEADYNNYDDVDDSRDFWILGDGQGHQRQFDSPITAKQDRSEFLPLILYGLIN